VGGDADYPRTPRGKPDSVRVMWTDRKNARLPIETSGIQVNWEYMA